MASSRGGNDLGAYVTYENYIMEERMEVVATFFIIWYFLKNIYS